MQTKNKTYLRAFEIDDYKLINKWRNDPQIQFLTGGIFRYVSSELEKEWVHEKIMSNKTDYYLAICVEDETDEMIGYLSINEIDYIHRTAQWGGIIIGNNKYRGSLAIFDVIPILFSFVFNSLNINRFSGLCLEEHQSSKMMMEVFLMKNEGRYRQSIYKNGKYHDQLIYSILQNEYMAAIEESLFEYPLIKQRVRNYINNNYNNGK